MSPNDAMVFVVDDDANVRRSVTRLLRAAGYTVRSFASPSEFLSQDIPQSPSCVLLDICMGELTGLDVQDALRATGRQVPVVFLSGHGTVPTAAQSIKHGAEDFLEKPIEPAKLLDAIARGIERDRKRTPAVLSGEELEPRALGGRAVRDRERRHGARDPGADAFEQREHRLGPAPAVEADDVRAGLLQTPARLVEGHAVEALDAHAANGGQVGLGRQLTLGHERRLPGQQPEDRRAQRLGARGVDDLP